MNKYQEALDYVNKSVCTALSCLGVNDTKTKESLHTLQELVDKATPKKPEQHSQIWNIFICPNCHCAVDGNYQKYCEECGQMLGGVEDE